MTSEVLHGEREQRKRTQTSNSTRTDERNLNLSERINWAVERKPIIPILKWKETLVARVRQGDGPAG
jgi:hypothetical protein